MDTKRVCKKCLFRDMAEEDIKNLHKHIDVIKMEDRVNEDRYNARLDICRECELLNAATCNACGCYVEVRAMLKNGSCPRKKWQ